MHFDLKIFCQLSLSVMAITISISFSQAAFANPWAEVIFQKSQPYYPQQQGNVTFFPKVMVFVSTSMPKKSLQQWAKQAEKIEASLYLRGFVKNSLKATIAKTQQIFGEEMPYGFEVHPEAFRQFHIQSVPAVVLITQEHKQNFDAPEQLPEFDVVYGNMGLEAALNLLAKQVSPKGRTLALELLERYRD